MNDRIRACRWIIKVEGSDEAIMVDVLGHAGGVYHFQFVDDGPFLSLREDEFRALATGSAEKPTDAAKQLGFFDGG